MIDWREWLKEKKGLLYKLKRIRKNSKEEDVETKKLKVPEKIDTPPLYVHIGLDFGTSWTKVAYRVLNEEYSGDVFFEDKDGRKRTFIESVVYSSKDGKISVNQPLTDYNCESRGFLKAERDLKMRLGPKSVGESAFNYSIFYLSRVIRKSKIIIENILSKYGKRSFLWSANIGIPTSYRGSSREEIYNRIINTAWYLADAYDQDEINVFDLSDILKNYKNEQQYPIDIIPELQANIFALTHAPAVPDGLYALFDVGGGTLDGSLFLLNRLNGVRKIDVIRTLIDPLGVDSIIQVLKEMDENLNNKEIIDILNLRDIKTFNPYSECKATNYIFSHVADIVHNGRQLTRNNDFWNESRLNIIIVGGGAHMQWFPEAILFTHTNRKLRKCGIPLFKQQNILKPDEENFEVNVINEKDFNRYFLAYGLSFPKEDHHEVVAYPEHHPVIKPIYRDLMNECWDRLNERYGEPYV